MKILVNKGWGWAICGVGACLAAPLACGSEFDSDCRASRTCVAAGGDEGGPEGPGGAGASLGGASGQAGEAAGGDAASSGAGGRADEPSACTIASDCSNGDATDGVEACVAGTCVAGNAPPRVLTVSPDDADTDVEPTGAVTLKFSEELDEATITQDSIRVLDGDVVVEGELSYELGEVTFTPTERLALLGEYRVEVTTGVTDREGAPLLEDFSSQFTVRDGAWHTIDAAKGDFYQLSASLPIARDGSVLLSWSGGAGVYCPTTAAWFALDASTGSTRAFTDISGTSCAALETDASTAGVGAVSWAADSSFYVQQYRDGAWLAKSFAVPTAGNPYVYTVAVAPDGVVTRFQSQGSKGMSAFRTSATGSWSAQADVLSTTLSSFAPQAAFDQQGNGVAVWRATDAMNRPRVAMSRYTLASGKWSAAEDVPGSLGTTDQYSDMGGSPAVVLAPDGRGMIVWRKGQGSTTLMASYHSPQTGWGPAEVVSAGTTLTQVPDRPGLTFDGERFVAAWVGSDASASQMFTSAYDPQSGWAAAVGHDAELPLPFPEMPRIVSDGRGSLLLVWKTGEAPSYGLVLRRFVAGEWGAIAVLPGGSIADKQTQGALKAPVGMNDRGVAAISWANRDDDSRITSIRLARFY